MTLVAYRSFLGATRKYALWLAEDIGAVPKSFNNITTKDLEKASIVVVMSGTYLGKMPLIRFLEKYWNQLQQRKVLVVAVGVVPADDAASVKSFEMIPEPIRKRISYMKIPGKLGEEPAKAGLFRRENLEPVKEFLKSF